MTRINAGIDPRSLTRQHLFAELREIKRIPNAVASGKARLDNPVDKFTLGPGHVKFFYRRCGYLLRRYRALYAEAVARGYHPTDFSSAWDSVPASSMGDWEPSASDTAIVQARIDERLAG
jgi:deoxyribonuclease (pyrimidine dimer)